MYHLTLKAAELISQHEGLALHMHKCPADKYTIGFGHNLESTPITPTAATVILHDDVREAIHNCISFLPKFKQLSILRQICMVDMMFNLGPGSFAEFQLLKAALNRLDHPSVVREILDSEYARQLPVRSNHIAEMYERDEYLVLID